MLFTVLLAKPHTELAVPGTVMAKITIQAAIAQNHGLNQVQQFGHTDGILPSCIGVFKR